MSTATALCTAEQLIAMPGDGWRYELVDGVLRRTAPAGQEHGRVAMNLSWRIGQHVRMHALGVVYAAETGFLIRRDPDTVIAPNVAFVSAARARASGAEGGYFPGAPDLAVEVVSPSDAFSDVQEKVLEWLEAGAAAVVVVDPRRRHVALNRSRRDMRVLAENETLDLGFVLPGFTVGVAEIFE